MARKFRDRGGKAKATRVRTKTFSERTAGGTIKKLTDRELPTGCSVLTNGIPCTFAMTHVSLRVHHAIWDAQNEPAVILEGYCKRHRPKVIAGSLVELPTHIAKQINGRGAKGKIKRMEKAMYLNVVPRGGVRKHLVRRTDVSSRQGSAISGWLYEPMTALCGHALRQGYVPTLKEAREDYPDTCPKCEKAKAVVNEEE